MARIPTSEFLNFCKSVEGKTIHTLDRKKEFTFKIVDDGLEFTPASSMRPRSHTKEYVDGVLDLFEETQSLNGTPYHDYTVNSSYMLPLIDMYLRRRWVKAKKI